MAELRRPPLGGIILGFAAFWVALIILFTAQSAVPVEDWRGPLRGALGLWLPWIFVSPLMLLMAVLLPLGSRPAWQLVLAHLAACSIILFAGGWLSRNVFTPSHDRPPPGADFLPPRGGPPPRQGGERPLPPHLAEDPNSNNFMRGLPVGVPLYATALLLVSVLRLRRISQDKELQAADLERQLTSARLDALISQLQPHFIFNTLNTLLSLLSTDPAKAEGVVLHLSGLLRATLDARDKPLISLRKEMELAHDYLEIQRARFGEMLQVEEEIDSATMLCAIPPLILQPLLENAIKYALEKNSSGARLRLRTQRIKDKLVVEVEDSGAGQAPVAATGHGTGVGNVRERLRASFPNQEVTFDLFPNELGGVTARLQMPALLP